METKPVVIDQYRNPGKMQEPQTPEQQKASGLIARVSKSIHGTVVKSGASR